MSAFNWSIDRSQWDAEMRRLTDPKVVAKAMGKVARALYQHVLNTFRNQTDPWGVPWPAWADSTKAGRAAKKDRRKQMLIDSGDLYRSIDYDNDENSATVFAGGGLDYAEAMQFGTGTAGSQHNVNIPARPFFPMRNANEPAFPDDWIRDVFRPIEAALNGE